MKRIYYICLIMMLLMGLILSGPAAGASMTPQQILERADRARGNIEGIEWEIEIVSIEKGRKQKRAINVKARDNSSLAETRSPARLKGQKLVMLDRNMWFIKPGLSKPVPISPRQKLMGGAANGDIASTNYAGDYEPVAMSDDVIDGQPCYVLDLKATNKRVTYDRILYWVSKTNLVGIQAEFFSLSGKRLKSARFEYDNTIRVNGVTWPFVSKMIITDAMFKGNVTTMTYDQVKIKSISMSAFDLNLLLR